MEQKETTNRWHEALARPAASCAVFAICFLSNASVANATIDNTATASGDYGTLPVTSNSVTVNVPVNSNASISVVKSADDDTNVVAGQVITYTYEIRNTGTTTVSNINLSDSHNASGPVPVPGGEVLSDDVGTINDSFDTNPDDGIWSSLAPGDAITLQATYTVTQSDVETLQ
jgi:large repetitive protein